MTHSEQPCDVRAAGSHTVVTFTQTQLDDETVLSLGPDLDRLVDRYGRGELRLDFGRVGFLCSTGLGKLVALHKRVSKAGGRLVLTNLDPFLFDLFIVTRLETILDVRRRDPEAA